MSGAPELEPQSGMILIHTGMGLVLALENAPQIRGKHLHINSLCFCCVPEPCKEREYFLPALQVVHFSWWFVWFCSGFFDAEGHICYQNVFSAVEQIILLTPVRLLVEGRQEKKLALAGEVLVHISVHSGRLCGCLLPI